MTVSVVVSISGRRRSLHGRSDGFNYDPSLCMMQQQRPTVHRFVKSYCSTIQWHLCSTVGFSLVPIRWRAAFLTDDSTTEALLCLPRIPQNSFASAQCSSHSQPLTNMVYHTTKWQVQALWLGKIDSLTIYGPARQVNTEGGRVVFN